MLRSTFVNEGSVNSAMFTMTRVPFSGIAPRGKSTGTDMDPDKNAGWH
jgi:hypothetical protein